MATKGHKYCKKCESFYKTICKCPMQIAPCKKCGSLPTLYQPEEVKYPYGHSIGLDGYLPDPYYRCEVCIVLADKAKKQGIIDNWNKEQS